MDRLQSMRVFQRVVDEGGFAAAARALDLSPAVVTRLVADLEDDLGVRLLHRTTRRLTLSPAGEAYLGRLRSILQDIDEAQALASAHTSELAGVLRLSASPVLATHMLAPLVAGFRARYPKVLLHLEVDVSDQPAIEEFDVTLIATNQDFDADVVARKIIEADAFLVASPDYVKRRGQPRTPAELADHDHLRLTHPGVRLGALRVWPSGRPQERVDVEVQPVLRANHNDTLLRATLDGAGITSAPIDLVAPYLSSGALVRVLSPWITGELAVWAALPSRKFIPERTRRFVDYLADQAKERRAAALSVCQGCPTSTPAAASTDPHGPA